MSGVAGTGVAPRKRKVNLQESTVTFAGTFFSPSDPGCPPLPPPSSELPQKSLDFLPGDGKFHEKHSTFLRKEGTSHQKDSTFSWGIENSIKKTRRS